MDGVTAVDYQGNDITDRVTVTGSVNTSVPGTYELTYDVTDEAGNTATAVRIIRVLGEDSGNDNPGGGGTMNPAATIRAAAPERVPEQAVEQIPAQVAETERTPAEKPSGGQQTGNSPATGDVRGAWTPAYVSAILGRICRTDGAAEEEKSGSPQRQRKIKKENKKKEATVQM